MFSIDRDLAKDHINGLGIDDVDEAWIQCIGSVSRSLQFKDLTDEIVSKTNIIAVRPNPGGSRVNEIDYATSLILEDDSNESIDTQLERVSSLGLPEPSLVVFSGGKSCHFYWIFNKPLLSEEWEELSARFIGKANKITKDKFDTSFTKINQAARLCGTNYYDRKSKRFTENQASFVSKTNKKYDVSIFQEWVSDYKADVIHSFPSYSSSSQGLRTLSYCPICGRHDKSGKCKTTINGEVVLCHNGDTFSSSLSGVPQEEGNHFVGLDDRLWVLSKINKENAYGTFNVFRKYLTEQEVDKYRFNQKRELCKVSSLPNLSSITWGEFCKNFASYIDYIVGDEELVKGEIPLEAYLFTMKAISIVYHGNPLSSINDQVIKAWTLIWEAMNNDAPGMDVISASCGVGKSVTTIAWSILLNLLHPEVGSVILVRETVEIDKRVSEINDISREIFGTDIAVSSYKDSEIPETEYLFYPVVVTTHASISFIMKKKKRDFVSLWQHGKRSVCIGDEALPLTEISFWNKDRMIALIQDLNGFRKYSLWRDLKVEIDALDDLIYEMNEDTSLISIVDKENNVSLFSINKMLKDVVSDQWTYTGRIKKKKEEAFEKTINKLQSEIYELQFLFSMARVSYDSGDATGVHYLAEETMLPGLPFKTIKVMDASALIDVVYQSQERLIGERMRLHNIPKCKTFENSTIYLYPQFQSNGKTRQVSEKSLITQNLLKWIKTNQEGPSLLLGTQELSDHIESKIEGADLDHPVHVGHYGAITGKNDWKDCVSTFLLSLPYPPKHYAAMLRWAEGNQTDAVDELGKETSSYQVQVSASHAAVQLYHAAMRGRIRKHGQENSSKIYLPIRIDLTNDQLIKSIKKQGRTTIEVQDIIDNVFVTDKLVLDYLLNEMVGIQLGVWDIDELGKKVKMGRKSKYEAILNDFYKWVEDLPKGSKTNIEEFISNRTDITVRFKKVVIKQSDVLNRLIKLNASIESQRGKGSGGTFIQK